MGVAVEAGTARRTERPQKAGPSTLPDGVSAVDDPSGASKIAGLFHEAGLCIVAPDEVIRAPQFSQS